MLNTFQKKHPKLFKRFLWTLGLLLSYSLLGFILLPWLIEKNATDYLAENYDSALRLKKVQVNPFVLSLRIEGLELDDPESSPLVIIDEIKLNFQLSSLFNKAWTFKELLINTPEIFITRDQNSHFNFDFLLIDTSETEEESGTSEDTNADPGLFPILIYDFSITNSIIQVQDDLPVNTVTTRLGPNNIQLLELNTLANRPGLHDILITTETNGTLSWKGNLELNPLASTGHISINDSDFPLISQYIRDDFGIDITEGLAELELDYSLSSNTETGLNLEVNAINLGFSNIAANIFAKATSDPLDIDREVLSITSLQVSDGSFHWPERVVTIGAITLDDSLISLLRDEEGVLHSTKTPLLAGNANDSSQTEAIDSEEQQNWDVSVETFSINSLSLSLHDLSVAPEANLGISLNITIDNLSNDEGALFPTQLNAEIQSGGNIKLDGQFAVSPTPNLEFEIELDDIVLSALQPYLHSFTDLNLNSGNLSLSGHLLSDENEPLNYSGEINILDLSVLDANQEATLGSWNRLHINSIALSVAKSSLEISELLFESPYADIVIASNGSLNLGDVNNNQESVAVTSTDQEPPASTESLNENKMGITIGRIIVENGAADFADYSLPLQFSAKIAELEGDISTISSASNVPAEVNLEGSVDEFGLVRIDGSVSPLDINANTNLDVIFQNVDIPKFSAYMIPFAGRTIESGKLDLSLAYKVSDSQLDSENNILLRDFSLGEKVEYDGATSLPLDLAVALLKNTEGNIDLDLPISGDVESPEFSYGGIIRQVFSNIIIKMVSSPFSFLGSLVGFEGDDLETIEFQDGSAILSPPQLEKASSLAEALSMRPELILEVIGVVDLEADGLALKDAKLEALVESRIATLDKSDATESMYTQQQKTVFEALYEEFNISADPLSNLENIQIQFITQAENEDQLLTEQFDELAYVNELRKRLLEMQTISPDEFDSLAQARANNTKNAILAKSEALLDQVTIMDDIQEISRDSDEGIKMTVEITQ